MNGSCEELARKLGILEETLQKIVNFGEGNPNKVLIQAKHMEIMKIAEDALEQIEGE